MYGQGVDLVNDAAITHSDSSISEVRSLRSFLAGEANGHLRNYFMLTVNDGALEDYWTNAAGGSIHYRTKKWNGFQLGLRGIFIAELISSDLLTIDTLVGKHAKWELELYDIVHPEDRSDLAALEQFFIQYHVGGSSVALGKIDINKAPLLLKRDGRMRAFTYRGIWAGLKITTHDRIYTGWINGVSPRGMTHWYSLDDAIGLQSVGLTPDGNPANYHGSANTRGLGVIGFVRENEQYAFQMWNYYLDRINNTVWLQVDVRNDRYFGGIQFVHQDPIRFQQRLGYDERYYQPGEHANVVNGVVGMHLASDWKISVSYLHGFDSGRFLFPRELGREGFYVGQARSWVDGFGAVNIADVRIEYSANKSGFHAELRALRVDAPEELAFNKYGVHSYYQSTSTLKYAFSNRLEGLEVMFLHVSRIPVDGEKFTPKEKFYRNQFQHLNLIVNLRF